jgi:hypothetical protein
LAFHRYPQLIRAFCNRRRFGPPPACSASFSLVMGRSPGFGSFRDDSSPFRTRVRSGSACPWLSLAAPAHSSAHSTKGTPSPRAVADPRLRPAGSAWFQDLFHSPRRGAFHRSLTVLVHYRSLAVFSLGRWSAPLQTGCHVSGPTHDPWSPAARRRHLRDSHPLRCPVPAGFGLAAPIRRALCRPLHQARPTPPRHRRQAVPPEWFGLLPLRSPLLRESSLLLGVLRCFTSPGALLAGHPARCPAVRRAGCPIRKPPDPRLPAPPRSIAPRGRVLPRPPTPRHPPCALLTEALVIPGGIPRPVPSGPRPGPTRASEDPVLPDYVPDPATFMTHSGFVMSRMTRSLPGPPDNCLPDFGDCRTSHYISNTICVQCARATGHDGPFLPRP